MYTYDRAIDNSHYYISFSQDGVSQPKLCAMYKLNLKLQARHMTITEFADKNDNIEGHEG